MSNGYSNVIQQVRAAPFTELAIAQTELNRAISTLQMFRVQEREQRKHIRALQEKVAGLRMKTGIKSELPVTALKVAKLPKYF